MKRLNYNVFRLSFMNKSQQQFNLCTLCESKNTTKICIITEVSFLTYVKQKKKRIGI
jgi:hypothetical protein